MVMMSSSKSRRLGFGVIICLVLAAAAAGAWTWWERTTRLRIVETCRRTVQLVGWYLFTYSDNGRNPACRYAFDEAVAKAHRICPGAVDVVDTYRGTISEPPSLAQLPPDLGKDLITLAVYESMMQMSAPPNERFQSWAGRLAKDPVRRERTLRLCDDAVDAYRARGGKLP
jgi:hypothetical protein